MIPRSSRRDFLTDAGQALGAAGIATLLHSQRLSAQILPEDETVIPVINVITYKSPYDTGFFCAEGFEVDQFVVGKTPAQAEYRLADAISDLLKEARNEPGQWHISGKNTDAFKYLRDRTDFSDKPDRILPIPEYPTLHIYDQTSLPFSTDYRIHF